MMNKEITAYLHKLSNNLFVINSLVVRAYLSLNNIEVRNNKLILSYIEGVSPSQVSEFIALINSKNQIIDFEYLIHLFEITIPSEDVVVNGAVYTPSYIKNFIVEESFKCVNIPYEKLLVADIACGAGAFLYAAAQKINLKTKKSYKDIFKENIYGLDISGYTIERAKILLSLLAISNGEDEDGFMFNLIEGNALSFEWKNKYKEFKGFDIVLGNPPYVRSKNIEPETKTLLNNWEVTKSGNTDLYIPFFEIGLSVLKQNGVLHFITVNTFKRSVNARNLREYFKTNKLDITMLDFGSSQVFENKSTYTCIVKILKSNSEFVKYQKISPENLYQNTINNLTSISYNTLNNNMGWSLNEPMILSTINKIETTGTPLGNKFLIKNGLATLSNDIFIFRPVYEDDIYFYHQNGKLHKIEKAICRDIIKPNRLKNELEIPKLKEQIIFPYFKENAQTNLFGSNNKKQVVFSEGFFQSEYPCAYQYLSLNKEQLLNRDKGKPKNYKWFEYGRTQALSDLGKKLLFPYMAGQPYFVYSDQEDLLLYAGYAIYFDSERELKVLKRILESTIFWYYIKKTSKPYAGNFYALAKNYVKDFGICELTEEEKDFLLITDSEQERNQFLFDKYKVNVSELVG